MKYLGAISDDYDLVNKKYVDDAISDSGGGSVTSVGISNATNGGLSVSGSPVTSSGTITVGHSNILTSAQTTQAVYPIKIDKNGHISAYGSAVTIPSDEKVAVAALTSGTTYYPILATGTGTATRQIDSTLDGLKYVSTAGTTSAVGTARLQLGNGTASGTANNEQGVIRLYGTTAYYTDIKAESGLPTANRTIYLPSYGGTMYLPCMSTTSAVGSANNPVYVEATGRIVAGNSFVPTTGGTFSGAVTAAASDGTTAQIANIKYGSAAPSGTATNGTVYFQTGSSAYTFQPRVNLTGLTANTTLSNWTSFTLPTGLYLITFQVNCGTVNTYNLRVDLIAGSNTITQIRTGTGANVTGIILDGAGLVECTSSTTIYFKAQTSSGTISNGELHYSYVKLF